MSLNKSNLSQPYPRLENLDFLRGLFVILALDQHFTYYVNMWYVEYFRDAIALTSTYKVHFPMIGHVISADQFTITLGLIFTPWVSQVYLTMAAFNLAKRMPREFKNVLGTKLKIFLMIFLFFVVENFMVAPNTGQAISFYPIMLWMIILGIISLVYAYAQIQGIIVITVMSLARFLIPMEMFSNFLQSVIAVNIHPGFEYDARIEYFFTSGCLGFLMGYVHYHRPQIKNLKDYYFILAGLVLVAFYVAYGDRFIIDGTNAFANEHMLAQTFSGTAYILGIQAIVISAFLWLEKRSLRVKFPIISWVGANSLLVFAFHRVLFVRLIAPLSILIGTWFDRTIAASTIEIYSYIGVTLMICNAIKKYKVFDMIIEKSGA